jgi:MFS family permease
MMCGYPFVGTLVKRFGNRMVSGGGAFLALTGTLPLVYLGSHGLVIPILGFALFIRGMGLSCVGVPSLSAAYSSVSSGDLPMATTALNIVMRIGGPTLTTVCATVLGWRLGLAQTPAAVQGAFTAAFLLLCIFHAALFAAAMRLPQSVEGTVEQPHTSASVTLERVSE